MGLAPKPASAFEFADESFSTEDGGDPAFASFCDGKIEGFFESDDVAGIHDEFFGDIDGVDHAERVEDDFAGSGEVDPEDALARQNALKTLPAEIDGNAGLARYKRSALNNEAFSVEFVGHHVSGKGGGKPKLAAVVAGGEVVEKEAFAREQSFSGFEQAAATFLFGAGGDLHVAAHGDHRPPLRGDLFARGEGDFGCGTSGSVEDFDFHGIKVSV